MDQIQKIILAALIEAGGEMPVKQLRALYNEKGDGMRHATLVRRGLTAWVRDQRNTSGSAIGVRITDTGRAIFEGRQQMPTSPHPAPSDDQLLRCWYSERLDTKEIASRFHYPEYNVESRLWRLRNWKTTLPTTNNPSSNLSSTSDAKNEFN